MQAVIVSTKPQTAIYSDLQMFRCRGSLSGHSSATPPLSTSQTTMDSMSSSPIIGEELSSLHPSLKVKRKSTSLNYSATCLHDGLEQCFVEKNLRRGGDSDTTLKNLQQVGADIS